jgi:hypothetical protein
MTVVADVRFKVKMRLRAILDTLTAELAASASARHALAMAQLTDAPAKLVKAKYRSAIVREFPGCTVTFTFNRVYVTLPNHYPAYHVPVSLPYPQSLRGGFFPKGDNSVFT